MTLAELTRSLLPPEKLEQLARWEAIQKQVKVIEDRITMEQVELASIRAGCSHETREADGKCGICGAV